MIIKEIIVVEGRDDTAAVQRAIKADTIETGGSTISDLTIQKIKKAQEIRGVIIFTDPDYAGERIRKIISKNVLGAKHAFITREEGTKNRDIGVENASPEVIIKALQEAKVEIVAEPEEQITWNDLIEEGLVGGEKAKQRRIELGNILGIGYANAKQLYKKLKMFQISQEEFTNTLAKIKNNKDEK